MNFEKIKKMTDKEILSITNNGIDLIYCAIKIELRNLADKNGEHFKETKEYINVYTIEIEILEKLREKIMALDSFRKKSHLKQETQEEYSLIPGRFDEEIRKMTNDELIKVFGILNLDLRYFSHMSETFEPSEGKEYDIYEEDVRRLFNRLNKIRLEADVRGIQLEDDK
jgi:hypothetical protein